jgi:predicted GNAT family N-acyltransferase
MEWHRGGFTVSDDPARLDRALVHRFIARESYWAKGIPEATMDKAIDHSLPFGLYRGGAQLGFARVVTDRSTFACLCDVFVLEDERGAGLGKWLVECLLSHPDLQGLRRFSLITKDAHELYSRFGFKPMADATRYLEIHHANAYGAG